MTPALVTRIARLVLNTADLDRACAFYVEALGFERAEAGGPGRAVLRLGAQEIMLVQAPSDAAPYPTPRAADDPWFQHFAIAVSDMALAHARVLPHVKECVSRGGPQLLPPSTGSVTAWKFRDPDGHPLELSCAPGSSWAKAAVPDGPVFLGIDHTALVVSDLEAAVAFYAGLGFTPGPRLLNRGPEQDRLDGLDGVELDIAVLFTPEPGPHLELLHYRRPRPKPARSIEPDALAATVTLCTSREGLCNGAFRDLDGHRLSFLPTAAELFA